MSNTAHSTETLPAELWMYIFELINTTQDLHSVTRTCRRFHSYGIRALHRNVVWKTPQTFFQNMGLWTDDNAMANGVRALQIGISTIPDPIPGIFVTIDGQTFSREPSPPPSDLPNWNNTQHHTQQVQQLPSQYHDASINTRAIYQSLIFYKIRQHFATRALYEKMISRMETFINLEQLTFKHMIFSDEFFGILHTLPYLRRLHLEFCLFPGRSEVTERDHSALPITNLTMLNLRRRVLRGGERMTEADPVHFFADLDDDIDHVLALSSAHNLRSLRVDSTADVFQSVYRKRIMGSYRYTIPAHLEHLYVQRKQAVDGTVQPLYHSEQLFPGAVYSIMERCPTLTTVSLAHPLPKHSSFPKPDSLPNLTHCEGVLETVMALTANRPLKSISVLRSDTPTEGILEMLARKAVEHPNLEQLTLHCKTWDIEILDAVCQLFPELRKLKITFDLREPGKMWDHRDYWAGVQPYEVFDVIEDARSQPEFAKGSQGPDEDTMVSFGPHFLYRLPKLHGAYIYAIPNNTKPDYPRFLYDNTFDTVEEELQNLVIPWNRYCKGLREVQLHCGYVMHRTFEGGKWQLSKVNEIHEGATFDE